LVAKKLPRSAKARMKGMMAEILINVILERGFTKVREIRTQ